MNGSPAVSVIILNYNGRHLLDECLKSLSAQVFRNFEVILVDNASNDGSAAFVRENFPDVVLIENSQNAGFGGGNNIGIEKAGGKYIVLLNNDTVVHPMWLESLYQAAERSPSHFGMWASKILFHSDGHTIDNVGHLIYPDGQNFGRGRGEVDDGQYDSEEEVLFPSGCACMYLKTMLDSIGLFDADFFAYGDDTELGLRARLAGWKCLYVPSAVVYHKYSATAGRYSPFKAFLVERNRVWVLMKYFPVRYIILSPFYTAKRLFGHFTAALRGKGAAGRFRESYSIWRLGLIYIKADLHALAGAGKMWRRRMETRRISKVSSKEFSEWLHRFGITAKDLVYKE